MVRVRIIGTKELRPYKTYKCHVKNVRQGNDDHLTITYSVIKAKEGQ